ncbi:MAG: hypothetical protein R2712_19990 [Vicinamibacterales bacterium]
MQFAIVPACYDALWSQVVLSCLRVVRASLGWGLVAAVLALTVEPALANREDLARALAHYNAREFDLAIEAATAARKTPDTQDAASVMLARALLERYRQGVDPTDLAAAREALGSVRTTVLDDRGRIEYSAVGQALFLEDEFGAAANLFASGVEPGQEADPALGEALVDWWGTAVERQADAADSTVRRDLFEALTRSMREVLADHPGSSAAAYWVAAALRGAGNPLAAWHAATAGWARARLAGERSAALRADLDKLVLQGIIPDRVKSLTSTERAGAELQLRAEWELLKERWK